MALLEAEVEHMLCNYVMRSVEKETYGQLTNVLFGFYAVILFKGAAHGLAHLEHLQLERGGGEKAKNRLGGDVRRRRPRGGLLLGDHPAHPAHHAVPLLRTLLGVRLAGNQLGSVPCLQSMKPSIFNICNRKDVQH